MSPRPPDPEAVAEPLARELATLVGRFMRRRFIPEMRRCGADDADIQALVDGLIEGFTETLKASVGP